MDREKLKELFANNPELEFLDVAPRKIRFKSIDHEVKYYMIAHQMAVKDSYHKALAYLLAFDDNISDNEERLKACFDFENDSIKPGVLEEAWVTGMDRRILTLAFNLWNESNSADVSYVFGGADVEHLLEAVRIRFA